MLDRVKRACGAPAAPAARDLALASGSSGGGLGDGDRGGPAGAGAIVMRLNNGLGNQLWQYAFGRLLAEVTSCFGVCGTEESLF